MAARNKKTIVLIEDEEVMVNLLVAKLTQVGYVVRSALDGASGLELIYEAQPDLVLLDMMLPRLNGFGVLDKLNEKKILPALPVIIISNSGQPIEIDRARKLGIRDYLIKVNFDINEVVTKVTAVLGEDDRKKAEEPTLAQVLIVEDDNFLVDLLQRKFSRSRVKPLVAMDAEHARLILNREKVDVVLLDVVLPGTDGVTLLKEFKANDKLKSIPVLIISNLGQTEEVRKGLAAGAVEYLIKANVTPAEILEKVMKLIKK